MSPDPTPSPPVAAKFCPRCRQELPARCFWRSRGRPDGLASTCIECHRRAWGHARGRKAWRGPTQRGEWKCLDCGAWKAADAFRPPQPGRRCPKSICRRCEAARTRDSQARRLADPAAREARRAARRAAYRAGPQKRRRHAAAGRRGAARRAVARLLAAGWSVNGIARATGCTWHSVRDWRDARRAVTADGLARLQGLLQRVGDAR